MKTVAVVGTQWGDEGKGKIVDLLAADADVVVRFQGGNNAAHTLVVDGEKFILRLIPAGALHPGKVCVIGNGTVVDPVALAEELAALRAPRTLHRRLAAQAELRCAHGDAVPSRDRPRARGTGGKARHRHDRLRHRAGVRGQGGARGAALRRAQQPRALQREARAQCRGKERLPARRAQGQAAQGPGDRRPDETPAPRHTAVSLRHGRLPRRGGRRGQARAVRGRARHDARHRPRHLSVRDLVQLHRGRRVFRRAARARAPGRGARYQQGLHHAGWRGAVPVGNKRRARQPSAHRRRGVRQRDRAAAPDRMVRRGARAARGAPERDVGARAHQARRVDRNRSVAGVRRISGWRKTLRRDAARTRDARTSASGL